MNGQQRRWVFLALALLPVLALLGCGETYPGSAYPQPRPVVTVSPTLGGLAGAYLEAELAAGQREQAEAQATAQAALMVLTVQAADDAADAAQSAFQAQSQATARAIDARATIQVLDAQATAQAIALEATRTAEARHGTATAQAEITHVTATAAAWEATAASAAGHATATSVAGQATETAQAHLWQQTVAAGHVTATAQARQQEQEEMDLRRARLTQPLRTFGPWVLLILSVIAIGYIGWRLIIVLEIRLRQLKRNALYASGDERGAVTLLNLERFFWGSATIIDGEVVTHEPPPTPELQARVVAGDQAVEMMTRNSGDHRPFTRRQRARVAKRLSGPTRTGGVPGLRTVHVLRSVDQATRAGILPPALAHNVEKDWIEGEWEEE
jgi:hypothetical protein